MPSSTVLKVPRHPKVPFSGGLNLLRSGFWHVHEGEIVGAVPVEARIGKTSSLISIGKLGSLFSIPNYGWFVPFGAGYAFINDIPKKFFATGTKHFGLASAMLAMPAERFESEFVELMTDRSSGEKAAVIASAVIASVDIVEVEVRSRFLGLATYLRVVTESQEGVRLECDFKAGRGWFGGVGKKYFYERWLQEFTALAMPIIDDALGGEAFWDRVRQELKERGLTVAPASDEITLGVLFDPGNPPRVLDGPDETLEAIEDLAIQGLEKAGFCQTEAMAKLYLYHNPTTVKVGDFLPSFAWWEAMKDQKLAATLLDLWQPIWADYHAVLDLPVSDEAEYTYLESLEKAARGEPID